MVRRICGILSAVSVVLAFGIPVRASEPLGIIRVIPMWMDSFAVGGEISLYRIGEPVAGGYRVSDGLADWIFWRKEIATESFLHWTLERADRWLQVGCAANNADAVFSGLGDGLYLVRQTLASQGFSEFKPFVVALSEAEGREITVTPQVVAMAEAPRTGDRPAPIFSAMVLSLTAVLVMVFLESRR